MAKQIPATREGIEAASRTYKRCTSLLRDELEGEPTLLRLGPREEFEATVTLFRALLIRRGEGAEAVKVAKEELTQDDFSFNDVLRLLRLTAIRIAGPRKYRITREEFIRRANAVLEKDGGLKGAARLVPKAKTGRYTWIEEHIQTFLHRNRDVVRRSKKHPDSLRIIAAPSSSA